LEHKVTSLPGTCKGACELCGEVKYFEHSWEPVPASAKLDAECAEKHRNSMIGIIVFVVFAEQKNHQLIKSTLGNEKFMYI
jgi:hypothetical protein